MLHRWAKRVSSLPRAPSGHYVTPVRSQLQGLGPGHLNESLPEVVSREQPLWGLRGRVLKLWHPSPLERGYTFSVWIVTTSLLQSPSIHKVVDGTLCVSYADALWSFHGFAQPGHPGGGGSWSAGKDIKPWAVPVTSVLKSRAQRGTELRHLGSPAALSAPREAGMFSSKGSGNVKKREERPHPDVTEQNNLGCAAWRALRGRGAV